jgi:hypothetical protein
MDDIVWFSQENTEGFTDEELEAMNMVMNKIYKGISEEQRENESYLDYIKERICYFFSY